MADLTTLLRNEAQAEISALEKAAQEEAARIVQAAKDQAASMLDSKRRALESQMQSGIVRATSSAHLETNALRLSTADSGMVRAFAEAQKRMRAFGKGNPDAYKNLLAKLAVEAAQALGQVEAAEVHPDDLEMAGQAFVSVNLHVPVRPNASIETGVRLIGKGGKSGITNTLLGRLERVRESLAPQVAQILNGS